MSESRRGAVLGLAAYTIWGGFPAFFKLFSAVPVTEVLAHRILWSTVVLFLFISLRRGKEDLGGVVRDRKTLGLLSVTTCLLATNWFTFLGAVTRGQVLESSLGYYINPLVSVLLGFIFLRERLTLRQKVSIALAGAGVLVQTVMVGKVPLVSLVLAFSFGAYGLVWKYARVRPVSGLAVEMILLAPVALGYLVFLVARGEAAFLGGSVRLDGLLVLTGVVTSTPLVFYGGALNRLRLSTMGIMQYIVPTGHFCLAVFAFGERFTPGHLVSFSFIWVALFLYTSESFRELKPVTQAAGQAGA